MRKIIPMLIVALLITACTTLDCPMNNTVSVRFALRGPVDTLADTLTIMAVRPDKDDSTLFNRGVETTHFLLPMSYSARCNSLALTTAWSMPRQRKNYDSISQTSMNC